VARLGFLALVVEVAALSALAAALLARFRGDGFDPKARLHFAPRRQERVHERVVAELVLSIVVDVLGQSASRLLRAAV
jgi:hypothetical protein